MASTIPHAAMLCCGECKGEWDPTSQPALAWAGSMTQALPDQGEADAARWIKENGTKPVVGFIAGETAPKGRTMGHAGAIVGGSEDTAEAKKKIMRECGIHVVDSPAQIGHKMAEALGVSVS